MPDKAAIARLLAKAGPQVRSRTPISERVGIVARLKATGRLRGRGPTDLASATERRARIAERGHRADQRRRPSDGD